MMKKILAIIFLLILAGVAIWQTIASKDVKVGLEKGDKAPDFELLTLNGETKKISDFQGKKVILNFWATWCPPCKEEMPEMQKLYEDYSDEIEIVAVNFTASESNQEKVKQFIENNGFTFPILLDPKNKANSGYEVLTYPTTYFLNEDGIIQDKVVGQMTKQYLMEKIDDM
ncbi:TlpA family protein disulfide reductase [Aeribacillus alveayuensis]